MTQKPIIAVTGAHSAPPDWIESLRAELSADYDFRRYDAREGYVSRLADDLAALVLVDGRDSDWRYWATTPKSSPATRRIPVFLVTDEADDNENALIAGADMALSPDELINNARRMVTDFARVPDPARAEQLDCECAESLPPLAEQGFEKFNAGEFYAQHDLFEELWMETDGPVRDLYRAILQVGVAYYQILRGNHRGAKKMLLRSVQWLAVLPDECQGIDVKALREDSYRVRAALEKLPEDEIEQFDRTLLQPVKRVSR